MDNESLIKILEFIVTIFIAFVTAYITASNDKKKQVTEYFKKEGIKEQKDLLNFWSSLLLKDFDKAMKKYKEVNREKILLDEGYSIDSINSALYNIDDVTALEVIKKESYIYSSRKTIKYIGHYMQYIFHNSITKDQEMEILNNKSNKEQKKYMKHKKNTQFVQLFLISKIISNMKYDFTGEKMSSIDLLKLKIKDLDIKKKMNIFILEIQYFFLTNYVQLK